MALSHTVSINIRSDTGAVSSSKVYTADSEENVNETVPAAGTAEVDVTIDTTKLVSFFLVSDKDLNVKTNENVTGDDHFDLLAGKPLWWNSDSGDNPLTTPITKIYLNNAGASDAHVRGGFLVNSLFVS